MEKVNIIYEFFLSYFFLTAIFASLSFLDIIKINNLYKKIVLLYAFIFLVLFAGLRTDGAGLDYDSYKGIYESVGGLATIFSGESNFENIHGEAGFLLFNSFVKTFNGDFNIVLLGMASLSLGLVIYSVYLYSPFVFLSLYYYIFRFFFIREMGGIRFAVAASIVLFSLRYVHERKVYTFLISIGIASLFHLNAIAALPVYFINLISEEKKYNKYLLVILIVAFIIGSMPIMDIIMFLYSITNDYRLLFYAENMQEQFFDYAVKIGSFSLGTLSQLPILMLFWFNKNKLSEKLAYFNILFSAYFLSVFFRIALNQIPFIASRTGLLTSTVEMVILPSFLLLFKNKFNSNKYIYYLFIVLMGFISMFLTFTDARNIDNYGPYRSLLW